MDEQSFAGQVVDWLERQGWDVYQEVQFRRYSAIADIAAIQGGELIIVEVKRSLSLAVMRQASGWQSYYRAIAVPITRNHEDRHFAYDICAQYLMLGVIEVSRFGSLDWGVEPPPIENYWNNSQYMIKQLSPGHKTHARAGSANGGHYTPYRATMDAVKEFVSEHPGCTLREIVEHIENGHYSSYTSAYGAIRISLEIRESWCRIDQSIRPYKYYVRETA